MPIHKLPIESAMRSSVVSLFVVLMLSSSGIPGASSQEGQTNAWNDSDPPGDVESTPAGSPLAPDYVDLLELGIVMDRDGFTWQTSVAGFTHRDPLGFAPPEYWLAFDFGGETFHAVILARNLVSTEIPFGAVYRAEGDGWNLIHETAPTVDEAAGRLELSVPWNGILASDESSPIPGNAIHLTEIVAYWDTDPGSIHDPLPEEYDFAAYRDDYSFPQDFTLAVPGVGDAPLQVTVRNPLRFSNGEATTFHWPLQISHDESNPVDVLVAVDEANPQFIVDVPPAVTLSSGEATTVNLFVTTPFAHQHGNIENVTLSLDGAGGVTKVQVGIQYPAIPQPAGHHSTLWAHGSEIQTALGGGSRQYWLNPSNEDPRANMQEFPRNRGTCVVDGESRSGHSWWLPFDPALRIGLDGRVDEFGTAQFTLEATAAQAAGTVYARLILVDQTQDPFGGSSPGTRVEVDPWTLEQVVPERLQSGGTPIEADLPMPPELDLLPPQSDKNVGLVMVFCEDLQAGGTSPLGAGNAAPVSVPSFYLTGLQLDLPLNEYHDPVDIDSTGAAFSVTVSEDRVEAPPGAKVLFEPVGEGMVSGMDYHVKLLGSATELATLHGRSSLPGAPQVSLPPVSVAVPENGRTGDALEVILLVQEEGNPGNSAAVRLVVLVNEDSDRDDTNLITALGEDQKDTSAPMILVVGFLLAWLVVLRRTY